MGDRGSQVSVLGVRSMLRLVAGSGVIVSLVFVVSCARSGVQADAGGFGSDDVGTDGQTNDDETTCRGAAACLDVAVAIRGR